LWSSLRENSISVLFGGAFVDDIEYEKSGFSSMPFACVYTASKFLQRKKEMSYLFLNNMEVLKKI